MQSCQAPSSNIVRAKLLEEALDKQVYYLVGSD